MVLLGDSIVGIVVVNKNNNQRGAHSPVCVR